MARRSVWERIKEALEDAGRRPTQDEAARILKITQPSVAEWHSGDSWPKVEHLVTLAGELGVCVEWLYTERGPKCPPPPDQYADMLWSCWPRLTDAQRAQLAGEAKGMAGPSDDAQAPGAA